jgi:hypothetical protein
MGSRGVVGEMMVCKYWLINKTRRRRREEVKRRKSEEQQKTMESECVYVFL